MKNAIRILFIIFRSFDAYSFADFSEVPHCLEGKTLSLSLKGAIDSYQKSSWDETLALNRYDQLMIFLDSKGGQARAWPEDLDLDSLSLEVILDSFKVLKSKGILISVILLEGNECKSACTGILAGADKVIASSNSTIGFHAAWKPGLIFDKPYAAPKAGVVIDEKSTNWYLLQLLDHGIDYKWVINMKKKGVFSSTQFTDFSPQELIQPGFVTEISDYSPQSCLH